jgi:hypothetical protein
MISYNLPVFYEIFIFTDAVGYMIKLEIIDIKNEVAV